jgi:hypothetical protein
VEDLRLFAVDCEASSCKNPHVSPSLHDPLAAQLRHGLVSLRFAGTDFALLTAASSARNSLVPGNAAFVCFGLSVLATLGDASCMNPHSSPSLHDPDTAQCLQGFSRLSFADVFPGTGDFALCVASCARYAPVPGNGADALEGLSPILLDAVAGSCANAHAAPIQQDPFAAQCRQGFNLVFAGGSAFFWFDGAAVYTS